MEKSKLSEWTGLISKRGILRKEIQTKNSRMIPFFRRRSHSYAVF